MDLVADKPDFKTNSRGDRVGIWASILCAIHCALTPVLLIVLPSFGKAWSHPSTHWGMALVVIPIAIYMMKKGYLKHGKKWILAVGTLGITLILIGAVLPYIESNGVDAPPAQSQSSTVIFSEPETENQCHTASPGCTSDHCSEAVASQPSACVDQCCPSIVTNDDGDKSLYIPPASIVTTLGGLCLILVHVGNLCCACCKKTPKESLLACHTSS